jgi:hypothetical protein
MAIYVARITVKFGTVYENDRTFVFGAESQQHAQLYANELADELDDGNSVRLEDYESSTVVNEVLPIEEFINNDCYELVL